MASPIDEQNIVDIAKNVIKTPGWKCEWGSTLSSSSECRVVLGSWNAYLQHLFLHCKYGKPNNKNKHPCHLPRCNVPQDIAIFDSYDDLIKHIESSHMNRVPLVCPISNCRAPVFSRSVALEAHMSEFHQGLSPNASQLLPLWTPSFKHKLQPPHLPTSCFPAAILTGVCSGSQKATKLPFEVTQTQFPGPKKYLKLAPRPESNTSSGQECLPSTTFIDLVKESDKHGLWTGDLHANCLVQKRGIHIDLSRPQNMLASEACIYKLPPQTIHYQVFEKRLESLERAEPLERAEGVN